MEEEIKFLEKEIKRLNDEIKKHKGEIESLEHGNQLFKELWQTEQNAKRALKEKIAAVLPFLQPIKAIFED